MHNMMWQDNDGQWWFFGGVESILVQFHPASRKGRPPFIECNTRQEVVGVDTSYNGTTASLFRCRLLSSAPRSAISATMTGWNPFERCSPTGFTLIERTATWSVRAS
jgi:hypothetical protein